MSWDEEYKREVLEPARAAGDQPPEDLRVRYALTEPLVPAEVTARVKQVRQCWRRARGQLKYRKLVDRLEAEHRELASAFAAAEKGDLRPLTQRLRGGEERTARRRAEARARLLDVAGAVRMVTPGDITAIARSSGVGAEELAWLARAEHIDVREPDRLPAAPPYAGYARAREALDVLGHRQLADFLTAGLAAAQVPIPVLDGARPDPRLIERATAEWARRARDTSSSNAETVLIALKSADPGELLLYDVVDRLRERHRQRSSEAALLHHAVQGLGIEASDARRLVFAVRREDGPTGGAAGRLRELLDAGDVHAAAELAATLHTEPGTEPDGDAAVLAAEARRRVTTATQLRDRAAGEADPDAAWLLLTDALHLVPDLPGAEELRRRLPPRPPTGLRADATGTTVVLGWEPSRSAGGAVEYRVLRRAGGPPLAAETPFATVAEPGLRDESAPVNARLWYAVTAVRGEAASEPALVGPVVVRPEPRGVELTAGDTVVTGRWSLPDEAADVGVTRSSAADPEAVRIAADRLGFTDRDLQNDVTYHYRISAVYADPEGRPGTTSGVVRSVTPSAPPVPVGTFDLVPDTLDPTRLLVAFSPPRRGTAEVVLLPGPPPWQYGAVVPVDEVRKAGRPLPATPAAEGLAVRTRGGGVLVVVTVAGRHAAVGPHRRYVSLPPPPGLTAQRRADAVHLGFDWPPGVAEVEVGYRWGEVAERLRISRAAYDSEGGVHLDVPAAERVEIAVAACADGVTGSASELAVEGRPVVAYDLGRSGPLWRRSLVLTLSAPQPVHVGDLRLVLRPGRVMPNRASDGETLATWTDLDVVGDLQLTLPEPSRKEPYWLRCFSSDETLELADPPVRRLQVN